MPELLLALDAGTTGVRAMLIDPAGNVLGVDRQPIASRHPAPDRVEQDGAELWTLSQRVIAGAIAAAGRRIADVAAIGVTTQRASTMVWDRASGEPVAPILVWSDLRGLQNYRDLRAAGFTAWPQVPSAKLPAALAMIDGGTARAAAGELRWGTVDAYLVARLSGGAVHATDLSNAWMTGYLDADGSWNQALLAHQGLPEAMFPVIVDSWGALGSVSALGNPLQLGAILADQQGGMLAHDALGSGACKVTYGTSAVLMASTGTAPASPHHTMPAEALCAVGGQPRYCVEGMVISAGSFIEWACGPLGLFENPAALAAAAASVADSGGVHIRPSLVGLGAPHGRFQARGLIAGLSMGTSRAHLARAALASIAHRIREIASIIAPSGPLPADGGIGTSDILLQLQADTLGRPVRRHAVREATAYGAAIAAGIGAGLLREADLAGFARYDAEFRPQISRERADAEFSAWAAAIAVSA